MKLKFDDSDYLPDGTYTARIESIVPHETLQNCLLITFTLHVNKEGSYSFLLPRKLYETNPLLILWNQLFPQRTEDVDTDRLVGKNVLFTIERKVYRGKEYHNIVNMTPVSDTAPEKSTIASKNIESNIDGEIDF